jgi:Uma2 family endonuclease
MDVAVKKWTWEDIKGWPEYHGRTEIVDGELIVSPVASVKHQKTCKRLGRAIDPFVVGRGLGEFFDRPVHIILAEHVNYEPDCSFFARGREPEADAAYDGAPDLIIEVLSRSNREHDTVIKFRDYEHYGVRE